MGLIKRNSLPEDNLRKKKASELLKAADRLLKEGRFNEALEEVDKTLVLDPKNFYAKAYKERITVAMNAKPGELEELIVDEPAEAAPPAKPVEAAHPAKPVEAAHPVKPAEAAHPAKPAETSSPAKPPEAANPVKPVAANTAAPPPQPAVLKPLTPLDQKKKETEELKKILEQKRRDSKPVDPQNPDAKPVTQEEIRKKFLADIRRAEEEAKKSAEEARLRAEQELRRRATEL